MAEIRVRKAADAPPIPAQRRRYGPLRTALASIEVGGFVFVPGRRSSSQSGLITRAARELNRRFTARQMEFERVDGLGIWRLSDPPLTLKPEGLASACRTRRARARSKRTTIDGPAPNPVEAAYRRKLNELGANASDADLNAAWQQAVAAHGGHSLPG